MGSALLSGIAFCPGLDTMSITAWKRGAAFSEGFVRVFWLAPLLEIGIAVAVVSIHLASRASEVATI